MSNVVNVQDACVTYKIRHGASSTLKETVINALKRRTHDVEVQALRGISLQVNQGETLAVIGNNGAGKSTLLKLIARVLPPTDGRVIVRGTVSPMIELGAGFNPELTGRENVILYGTLLGRRPKDMIARCESIAEWAGLENSIDLPLRTYSSGMVARLAFSVATDHKADLLLIDEVLSVGDAEFQTKSKKRMNQLLQSGAAVVLVTHDLETVRALASKVIWINRGRVQSYGEPLEVISEYLKP